MELFIQIKDGKPFEHPILADNFGMAFPHVDQNNLPPEFARFVRVEKPKIGVYEIYAGVNYELVNGVYTDVHRVVPMTSEQIAEKQNFVKQEWAKNGYPSWVFHEASCNFLPPVRYPCDGKKYEWSEEQKNWVEVVDA